MADYGNFLVLNSSEDSPHEVELDIVWLGIGKGKGFWRGEWWEDEVCMFRIGNGGHVRGGTGYMAISKQAVQCLN
jgi:hypothetical protein